MLKRPKLGTRTRVLVVVGIVALNAMNIAFAGPPAPTAHVVDGSDACLVSVPTQCDGWLNKVEVDAGITLSGTYDNTLATPIDHIRVFVMNDPAASVSSCNIAAPQVARPGTPAAPTGPAGFITIARFGGSGYDITKGTINPDGTWVAGPFDISAFSEGAHVCARARSSDDGGVSYTELAVSNNIPVKDTVILAGTVALADPNADGFINISEFGTTSGTWPTVTTATPASVLMQWTANPALNAIGTALDATKATLAVLNSASVTPDATGAPVTYLSPSKPCGPYDAPAALITPSGSQPISNVCLSVLDGTGARLFPNYQTFTITAIWTDAAGNVTTPLASNAITRDTDPPAAPKTVTFSTAGGTPVTCNNGVSAVSTPCLNIANIKTVTFSGELAPSDNLDPFLGHVSELHAEALDTPVTITARDGTNAVIGVAPRSSMSAPDFSKVMDLTSLIDCNDITSGCVYAEAFVTDLAHNTSGVADTVTTWNTTLQDPECLNTFTTATCKVAKDTVAPAAPSVSINPNPITVINMSFVEVNVCGETGTSVTLLVDDDRSPDTLPIPSQFKLSSCRTVNLDLSALHDGTITATAYLTDTFKNLGATGSATAVKNTTLPAITIDSPAANSLAGKTAKAQGTALALDGSGGQNVVDLYDSYIDVNGQPHPRVKLNGQPIPVSSNSTWLSNLTFNSSGTHTLEAITGYAGNTGAANITKRVFDVDAGNPNQTITTAGNQTVTPGSSFIIQGSATDDFSGVYGVQIQIFDLKNQNNASVTTNPPGATIHPGIAIVDQATTCPLCGFKVTRANWSYDASSLPAGWYTVQVWAIDFRANNAVQRSTIQFLKLG